MGVSWWRAGVGLGAVEIGRWLDCRTLRAPGGHVVCVIPCHSDPETFARLSQAWEQGVPFPGAW